MQSDTDRFTFTWTRRQLYEVRQALKKGKQYLKQGMRRGQASEQEVLMVEALLDEIKAMLAREQDDS